MCDCHVPKLSLLHDTIQSSFLNNISNMSLILLIQYLETPRCLEIKKIKLYRFVFLKSDIIHDINHLVDILDRKAQCLWCYKMSKFICPCYHKPTWTTTNLCACGENLYLNKTYRNYVGVRRIVIRLLY